MHIHPPLSVTAVSPPPTSLFPPPSLQFTVPTPATLNPQPPTMDLKPLSPADRRTVDLILLQKWDKSVRSISLSPSLPPPSLFQLLVLKAPQISPPHWFFLLLFRLMPNSLRHEEFLICTKTVQEENGLGYSREMSEFFKSNDGGYEERLARMRSDIWSFEEVRERRRRSWNSHSSPYV